MSVEKKLGIYDFTSDHGGMEFGFRSIEVSQRTVQAKFAGINLTTRIVDSLGVPFMEHLLIMLLGGDGVC